MADIETDSESSADARGFSALPDAVAGEAIARLHGASTYMGAALSAALAQATRATQARVSALYAGAMASVSSGSASGGGMEVVVTPSSEFFTRAAEYGAQITAAPNDLQAVLARYFPVNPTEYAASEASAQAMQSALRAASQAVADGISTMVGSAHDSGESGGA